MRGLCTVALHASFASFALAAAIVAVSPSARAAENCGSPLVSTCINSDTLWPHAGPSQFLTVGGTETVAKGQAAFGLFTTYLSRPVTLHLPSPGPGGSNQFAVNDQVNGTFLFAYGVTNRLEIDLALPVTFGQGGAGVEPITGGAGLADTAVRDLRFGAAYAIIPRARRAPDGQSLFSLTARLETSAPTGDEDQFAGERAAVFIPTMAADARFGRLFTGAEVGARLRPTAELAGARVGSQILLGAGVGYDLLPRRELLGIMLEARAMPILPEQHDLSPTDQGLVSTGNGKHIIPAEWALAARSAPLAGGDFVIHAGGGGPFTTDAPITSPRFRFMLGIRYSPLQRDSDGDGVLDKDDKCPHHAGSVASGGCEPDKAPAKPAFEMRPGNPACDDDPDTVDGFSDEACPDEDTDKDGIDDRHDHCPAQAEDFAGLPEGCPEKR